MANIQQQKKRNRISERQREENLRYRSTVKTLAKRVEAAAAGDDKDKLAAEHLLLVRTVDKAASRGALHKNTAARKKSRAARVAAGSAKPAA
jgi:small subunit ribosomal protein S20